jgi:SOS response regulatory protein OraA/RecX
MRTRTANPKKPPEEAAQERSDYSRALDSLTRHLALRDHSRFELKTKLERRFDPELVERLLAEAEERGWLLPEDQVAERLTRALVRKHKSARYIEAQLRKRRLPLLPRTAEAADAEIETIRHLVIRKFGTESLSFEDKAKAYRFLKYRGFQDRAIRQVLNEKR